MLLALQRALSADEIKPKQGPSASHTNNALTRSARPKQVCRSTMQV
jgi:hypothetical protein